MSDGEQEEFTCPLIQLDFKDQEIQTKLPLAGLDAEIQTESVEAEAVDIELNEASEDGQENIYPRSTSCPHLNLTLSDEKDPDFLPLHEDILTFDLDRLNHFIMSKETDIVDDFVIL